MKVRIRIPQCRRCWAKQRVKPCYVDFDFFHMRFVVCSPFKQEFERLNGPQSEP